MELTFGGEPAPGGLSEGQFAASYPRAGQLLTADLREADLREADLDGANLRGADLTNTIGLTKKQVESATFDEKTRLSDYL